MIDLNVADIIYLPHYASTSFTQGFTQSSRGRPNVGAARAKKNSSWDNPGDQKVEVLQQHCKELGMDCSVFILSHNDLGPTNIIINGNRIVVLDWEMAGCQEAIAQSSSLSSGDVGRFIMSSSNALLLRWLSTRISDGVWPGAYSLAASPYMSNRLSMRH
jgi:hypothetical protein